MLMGEFVEHLPTAELFLNPKNPKTTEYIEGRYG
jgi:ABC-type phosphate transport system ATPase subunit